MTNKLSKIKPIINQTEIARRMNISQQYVSRIFLGKEKNKKRIEQIKSIINKELKSIQE